MRNINPAMQAALAGGATTLARCWTLIRSDNTRMGFTDHDRDIMFDGVTFAALSGVEGSQMEADFGFAVGGGEIAGALASEGLAESDLARGLWDNATVELWLVDWRNIVNRMLLETGSLGEIRRQGQAFTAELRGPSHRLDEERGRIYSASCTASLGDERCGVALAQAQWRTQAFVATAIDGAVLTAGATSHADRWFAGGELRWISGGNAGLTQAIADHRVTQSAMRITLWTKAPVLPVAGDAFELTVGCDKQFATCRDRFANTAAFRGFPHMPGNDHLIAVAREGEARLDGGSLFS